MNSVEIKTSRDRPKSAPYLGSKIAKGLQYVKVLVSWGPFYERKILEKKPHNAKKIEGATLWGNFFSGKKVSQCRKKLKGGPFRLARHGMLRGKIGKTFLVQFARPNSAIWCNNIL